MFLSYQKNSFQCFVDSLCRQKFVSFWFGTDGSFIVFFWTTQIGERLSVFPFISSSFCHCSLHSVSCFWCIVFSLLLLVEGLSFLEIKK